MAKLGKNQDPRCVYSNDELCAWASAKRAARVRGCGEGWASHFSVHARKGSELYIIAFVSGSHVLWF